MRPKGAVACGHPATAAAAVEILLDGGNAFDAVIAAYAAATVAEPVLCSLAGGGFLLARPQDKDAVLYDFFTDTPHHKKPPEDIDFYPIQADFGTATQEFHIGLGSVATPGGVKGIFAMQRDLARMPMRRLLDPAITLAQRGVRLRPVDGYLFEVVGPILMAHADARKIFARDDKILRGAGDLVVQQDLAAALEALGHEGEDLFYRGEIAKVLLDLCAQSGGHLTRDDLQRYQIRKRKPLERRYRGIEILTNPPPSSGGILIAFALELLSELNLKDLGKRTPEFLQHLGHIMELTNAARAKAGERSDGSGRPVEGSKGVLSDDLVEIYRRQVTPHPPMSRGTTHISIVDGEGNIAALSLSNGEGCGRLLPGTGIMLNNMLGEEDLATFGFHGWPEGMRMASMMSPTLALQSDGSEAALGSGGSNRIRTAILQVLINLIDFGEDVGEAVPAPRLHIERGVVNLEGGSPEEAVDLLAPLATDRTIRWPEHNLFFGGVHAVKRGQDGTLSAAGDPRRGGVAVVL